MRTVYWIVSEDFIQPVQVLFETEKSLLVRTKQGDEYHFQQKFKNDQWFDTKEQAEAYANTLETQYEIIHQV